jgi:hypothetical protein
MRRSHLINGFCQGAASAVPNSLETSGVLTPEGKELDVHIAYELGSSRCALNPGQGRSGSVNKVIIAAVIF